MSQLYASEAPGSILLAEYPSSNSDQTRFRNVDRYIIHDPFPPPRPELLKCLGPHHLMFGWGDQLAVTSQSAPPSILVDHWCRLLGDAAKPGWVEFDRQSLEQDYIVLFPHQSLSPDKQLVPPNINYHLHSKEVIQEIACPQAQVLASPEYPCIAKLSHGYAGLGNYWLNNESDYLAMNDELSQHWPGATVIFNSIIQDVCGDNGIQFFLKRDGSIHWLGFTEQNFDRSGRWCGGTFSATKQDQQLQKFRPIIEPTAAYLSSKGYLGVVGIDILEDKNGNVFLVDVNPRLTGITPFLIASRIFATRPGHAEGRYQASCRFPGNLVQLIEHAEACSNGIIAVLSAFDDESAGETICHLSVTADSQQNCTSILDQFLQPQT